jgi:hypothetical protein
LTAAPFEMMAVGHATTGARNKTYPQQVRNEQAACAIGFSASPLRIQQPDSRFFAIPQGFGKIVHSEKF